MVNIQVRRVVKESGKGRCEYCLCPASHSPDDFNVEHIVPQSRGGTDDLSNLAWSCQGCNSRKFTAINAIDSQTGELAVLYHPRRHLWRDHFRWSDDWLTLIGLTPTGRATIIRIDLNRYNVVNLRDVLVPAGKHPPRDE